MKYPLAASSWDDREIEIAISVLKNGQSTMGRKVERYEKRFAAFVGSRYAVMVNSGSSANLIMIAALFYVSKGQLKPGDEVIVPAVSWPTTYYPLAQYGLKLKFVDIDLFTLNYDIGQLKAAISGKTRLIVAVNLLGNPNDFQTIKALIRGRNIVLVEDNCESLGALYRGRHAGTFGIMGTFSTFFSHHMSTMEGGVVVTENEELYHIMLCLRAHGWTRNLPRKNRVTGLKGDDPFEESFNFVLPGYNVRPLEIEAAIGIEQLRKLPSFIMHRRKNAELFSRLFHSDERFIIQKEIGQSSWFGFSLVVNPESGLSRKDVIEKLSFSKIECRPIVTGNFTKNKVVQFFNHSVHSRLVNAELIDTNGFFVGNHPYDISSYLHYLKKVLA